ncbi:hypothetical protein AYO43_08270 [Nitrospira sp. SCGC AG-212-E16]|nr:hypothetical protein AYO43_08270 [Nitrospira sp. SCGC AG-212-E16]
MRTQTNILVTMAQLVVVFGMGLTLMSCGQGDGPTNSALAQQGTGRDFVAPTVFQAAGPTVASIQNTVDLYRTALGDPNNGNVVGQPSGRREINWDGGGSTATAIVGTPFTGFLANRGALFTTTGTGFVQAPLAGLVDTFHNPTYASIFQPFSLQRLFSPIDSNVTEVTFFVPGPDNKPATTNGFGAVFTDVDLPNGSGPGDTNGNRKASTLIECFGTDGGLIFSSFVPASPGDGSLSFFGIVFGDARIARVRITSGDAPPGPNDDGTHDIVMMDDFLYGEPQPLH